MDAQELLNRLKERKRAILGLLPPQARAEYDELVVTIRNVKKALEITLINGADVANSLEEEIKKHRLPLSERKQQLIRFLRQHGSATRSEILLGTQIPNGSLSNLLSGGGFEQSDDGRWQIKE